MPQMARSWPTVIWAPSPLYHFINLSSALKLNCLNETGLILIAIPATAIIHSPSPRSSLIGASTGLIHTDLFAQEFLAVQALNRRLSLRLRRHFYKTKPPGLATVLVFDHSR